jgi:hypothetical protein
MCLREQSASVTVPNWRCCIARSGAQRAVTRSALTGQLCLPAPHVGPQLVERSCEMDGEGVQYRAACQQNGGGAETNPP